ncbi:unnamed protein product [Protopolystoma xenopodis]|uniref:Uncharacterized protein n=1 Tax=Protopolystoma xenopodis TaxID=117903 RepID=A0A3S5FHE9_9PLAT|nr:unnamed protein product [Protopolystoma xenopodis]
MMFVIRHTKSVQLFTGNRVNKIIPVQRSGRRFLLRSTFEVGLVQVGVGEEWLAQGNLVLATVDWPVQRLELVLPTGTWRQPDFRGQAENDTKTMVDATGNSTDWPIKALAASQMPLPFGQSDTEHD